MLNEEITAEKYFIPDGFSLSESGNIPAMSLEEVETFLEKNVSADSGIKNLLKAAQEACRAGVTRVHILDGNIDGVLPCEIFSGLGSGTMIYTGSYGKVRPMQQTDIPSVLAIMRPNIQSGKLLPRTEEQIAARLEDYIVYELDGGVHACAALHFYDDGQAEIAAVAVDENYAHMGIGPKLMDNLIEQAVDLVLVIGADPAINPDTLRLVKLINPGDLPIMAVHRNRLSAHNITRAWKKTIAYLPFRWKASNHTTKIQ